LEWYLPQREKLINAEGIAAKFTDLPDPWARADKPPIAVVGSGPAGLINAYLLAAEGFPVTVFEAFHTLGGVLRYGIPEFRLPNELIDDVVSSREVGARKPDKLFYRAALLRAGFAGVPLAPERAVMVGDSLENDIAGAQAAGLRAIWLAPRRAKAAPGAPVPDARIRKLAELPAALVRLGGPHAPPRPTKEAAPWT